MQNSEKQVALGRLLGNPNFSIRASTIDKAKADEANVRNNAILNQYAALHAGFKD